MVSPADKARYIENLHEAKEIIDKLINYPACTIQETPQSDIKMLVTMSQSLKDVESYVAMKKTLEQLGIVFVEIKKDQIPCLLIQAIPNMEIFQQQGFQTTLENLYLENKRKQSEAIKSSISVNRSMLAVPPINLKSGTVRTPLPDTEKLQQYQQFFIQMMFQGKEAVTIEKGEVRIEYPESFENSYIHVSALESALKKLAIPHQMKSHGISKFVAVIPTHEMNTIMRDSSLLVKFINEYKKQVRHFTRKYQGSAVLEGFPEYKARHAGIVRALAEMENTTNNMPGSSLDNHAYYFSLFAEKMEELDKNANKNDNQKSAELLNILAELKGIEGEDAATARSFGERMINIFSENVEKGARVRKIPPTPSPSPPLSPSGTPPASPRGITTGQTSLQSKGPSLKAFAQVQEELSKKLQKRQESNGEAEMPKSPRKKN